jgi:hypothetical protein
MMHYNNKEEILMEEKNVVERRKTGHLTKEFKTYVTENLSEVLGVEVKEEQAWTIFKLCHKLPLRFLPRIEVGDFDARGEQAVSLPGVGKFKFRMTVPQGNRHGKVTEDGMYPRYKFSPAPAIEAEVEHFFKIDDEETMASYVKAMENESKSIEKTAKEITKLFAKSVDKGDEAEGVALKGSVESIVKELIDREVEKRMAKLCKNMPEEELNEDEPNEEVYDEDEVTENIDTMPVMEDVIPEKVPVVPHVVEAKVVDKEKAARKPRKTKAEKDAEKELATAKAIAGAMSEEPKEEVPSTEFVSLNESADFDPDDVTHITPIGDDEFDFGGDTFEGVMDVAPVKEEKAEVKSFDFENFDFDFEP